MAIQIHGPQNVPAIWAGQAAPSQTMPDAVPAPIPPSRENLLAEWQRTVMVARLAILKEIERMAGQGMTQTAAVEAFERLAKNGHLPAHMLMVVEQANHRNGRNGSRGSLGRKGDRKVSARTIYRWISIRKSEGNIGLAPNPPLDPSQEGTSVKVPEWAPQFLAAYRKAQKPSIAQALEDMGPGAPSYMQAVRFMRKFSNLDRERGRMTGSELKQIRGYIHRDKRLLMPLDVVVADGHSFKAYIAHPVHGKRFIPEVEGVIDVATRVCIGWSAGLAESAQVVADALRHAVTVTAEKPFGGCFAIWYTDSGSGNKAHVNSDPVIGVMARIGATWQHGIPSNPQGRGVIERMQGSLWIRAAKELPTYRGKGMDDLTLRRTLKIVDADLKQNGTSSLLLSWPQFIGFCERAVDAYNSRPHSELPRITDPSTGRRRHMTPAEMWQVFVAKGWKPMLLEPGELADLFRPAVRCVTRRGEVRFSTNIYFNKVLEHYHGEEVIVEYDIHDPMRVWVRDREGRMVCEALWNANSRDFCPKSMIEQAREKRRDTRLKLKRKQIAEIHEEAMGVLDMTITDVEAITLSSPSIEGESQPSPQPSPAGRGSDGETSLDSGSEPGMTEARPVFLNEWDLYRWLMGHPDERDAEDEVWMLEFEQTDLYRLMSGEKERAPLAPENNSYGGGII